MKKTLLILVIFLVLVSAGFIIYWKTNSGDIEAIDDSYFKSDIREIAEEYNAFFDFKKSIDSINLTDAENELFKSLSKGGSADYSPSVSIINRNFQSLEYFKKGSWKKEYQDVALAGDISDLRTTSSVDIISPSLFRVARIIQIDSRAAFDRGEEKRAFSEALDLIYAGQLILDSRRISLFDYLSGAAIKELGIRNMEMFLSETKMSSGEMEDLAKKLDDFKDSRESLKRGIATDYFMFKNEKREGIDRQFVEGKITGSGELEEYFEKHPMANQGILLKFLYKPNETDKLFFDNYKTLFDSVDSKCSKPFTQEKKNISFIGAFFTENSVGKIFIDTVASDISNILAKRCEGDFSIIKLKLEFLAMAYKEETGNFPISLEEVCNTYPQTCQSTFMGEPIRYDHENGEVSWP